MAKFAGYVAYAISAETAPGVFEDVLTKRKYLGDIVKDSRTWSTDQKTNDNLLINNRISIIADSFAHSNLSFLKCIKFGGVWWKVSNIEIQKPRLILTLGGLYNGPTP